MVLGSSEVRLIDMARAFASIAAGGVSVEPYGIVKVTTADGETLYEHEDARSTKLVPDYVAAGITDLLQTTVNTGTARAAQIGRPVAGKTGTTNANKDGWFLGFSSGITTGVWMGRDDADPVPGLSGGRAPAQAFAAYMRYAVKDRPVEEFDTELQLPEWQLEPDDEYYYGEPGDYYYIDEQGNLIEPGVPEEPGEFPFPIEGEMPEMDRPRELPSGGENGGGSAGQAASDDFLDRATGRDDPPAPASTGGAVRYQVRPAPTPQASPTAGPRRGE
jgi:penicillin-binding protein 1A